MKMIGRACGFWLAATLAALMLLTGCGDFFVPPNGGGGGGGTGSNYVYATNSSTSSLAGFAVGTGTLTAISGFPLSLSYSPLAAVVAPGNSYLYVAATGAIHVYKINSDGTLTEGTGVNFNVIALDVSPDGKWLFGLDNTTSVLDEFSISGSTGALTFVNKFPYTPVSGPVEPKAVKVSPAGNLIFIAIGRGGDISFTLNTSTGTVINGVQQAPVTATTSDNALAIDSTGSYLFIARSGTNGGVGVYTTDSNGKLTPISGSPFAAGMQPSSAVIDSTGKYLYVANGSDDNISGYAIGTGGVLTALTGSPYASGSSVISLGIDKTGKYLLAGANGGNPDLSMYSFDATTPGKLDLVKSVATGTDPTGVTSIALTH
jgi:6-phosphogluconolactonase (cycloisomerase 2 family)